MKKAARPIFKNNTSRRNVNYMVGELSKIDWSIVCDDQDVRSSYRHFSNSLTETFSKCYPLTKVKLKINLQKSPWMTKGILNSVKRKSKLYSSSKQNPTVARILHFVNFKNVLTETIENAMKMHYCNLIQGSKGDTTRLWNIIINILCKK